MIEHFYCKPACIATCQLVLVAFTGLCILICIHVDLYALVCTCWVATTHYYKPTYLVWFNLTLGLF